MSTSRNLSDLEPGDCARVVDLSDHLPGAERRRLLEIGFFPGTPVTAVRRSPLGDPVAYEVRGMVVALRHAQAREIEIDAATDEAGDVGC
jgi:Fe2+ transport system protein FeoA